MRCEMIWMALKIRARPPRRSADAISLTAVSAFPRLLGSCWEAVKEQRTRLDHSSQFC